MSYYHCCGFEAVLLPRSCCPSWRKRRGAADHRTVRLFSPLSAPVVATSSAQCDHAPVTNERCVSAAAMLYVLPFPRAANPPSVWNSILCGGEGEGGKTWRPPLRERLRGHQAQQKRHVSVFVRRGTRKWPRTRRDARCESIGDRFSDRFNGGGSLIAEGRRRAGGGGSRFGTGFGETASLKCTEKLSKIFFTVLHLKY